MWHHAGEHVRRTVHSPTSDTKGSGTPIRAGDRDPTLQEGPSGGMLLDFVEHEKHTSSDCWFTNLYDSCANFLNAKLGDRL